MATDLPDVPQSADPVTRRLLVRMREALQQLMGTRGDGMDAALTRRSAYEIGLVDSQGRAMVGDVTVINNPGGGGGSGGYTPDLTPPPTVTGLTAAPGLTQIFLEWNPALYAAGNGHKQTNIYAVKKAASDPTLPTFGDATLVFSATGALTVASLPSDLSVRWHIWAKWETNDGVESSAPAGGVNGVVAQTGKIGNADLGPLVVEAQNLANSAIPTKMGVAKFDTITLRGTGLNGSDAGPGLFYVNAASQGTTLGRGFTVRVFDRATHAQIGTGTVYDTYADAGAGTHTSNNAMAAALNALGDNRVVMIASYDACSFNSTGDALRIALKRLGASPAIDGALAAQRFQYALVGIPGWGQGNGLEMLKPPTAGLPPAEVACFWLDNTILGSGSTINGLTLLTGDYFVDGSVQARHLAAGSIAVGTAAIANGAILNAMIANATIDNAKIANVSVSKLLAGSLAVGQHITSTSYVSGVSGWYIGAHGFAEFSDVVIRGATYTGTIFAGAGTIGGITITASDLRTTNYVPGTAGIRMTSSGYFEASNVWLRGQISGGSITGWGWPGAGQPGGFYLGPSGLLIGNYNNGQWVQINIDGSMSMPGFSVSGGNAYFAGTLQAAGGSFSGTLTADAVNAVNTINIGQYAVTVPATARLPFNVSSLAGSAGSVNVMAVSLDPRGGSMWAIATGRMYLSFAGTGAATATIYVGLYIGGVLQQEIPLTTVVGAPVVLPFAVSGQIDSASGDTSALVVLRHVRSTAVTSFNNYIEGGAVLVANGGRR